LVNDKGHHSGISVNLEVAWQQRTSEL